MPRWLRWSSETVRGGRTTKRPRASTKNGPWVPLDRALQKVPANLEPGAGGVGFVMTGPVDLGEGRHLFALDLDACRDPETGEIAGWAREVVQRFATYTEVTPSGSGLRILGYVTGDVPSLRVIPVQAPALGTTHRRCEIQVFGAGPASYVTLTGQHINGTPQRLYEGTEGFAWLENEYPEARCTPLPEIEVHPVGREPTVEELDTYIRDRVSPSVLSLADTGDWASQGYPSASEGWYVLVQSALAHCADHVDVAVRWLIEKTAYGHGQIEDSKDPGRYSSERWVRADLLRLRGKQQAQVSNVFDVIHTNGTPSIGTDQRGPFDASPLDPMTVFEQVEETTPKNAPAVPAEEPDEPPGDTLFFEPVASLVARDPRPKWLVQGIVEQDSLVVVSGAPGSYKSFFALDLALALATGQPWHGRHVKGAPVLLLAGEGHGGLARRFQAWFKEYDLSAEKAPVAISRHAGQMLDDKQYEYMVSEAKKRVVQWGRLPGLVVIDTLNRNFGPGDENSTEDVTKFLERCDRLRRVFPGVTVMIVHHVGHGAANRSRGSSVIGGTVDAEIILSRDREQKTGKPKPGARALFRKMKDAEEPAPFWLIPKFVELGTDDLGEVYGSLIVDRITDEPPATLNLLADPEFQRDITRVLEMYRVRPTVSRQDVLQHLHISRRRHEQVVTTCLDHGLLEQRGNTSNRTHHITAVGLERLSAADDLAVEDAELDQMLDELL